MTIRTLLCVFILWMLPIFPESPYSPIDSFLTLEECKVAGRPMHSGPYTYLYTCLPSTLNPNH